MKKYQLILCFILILAFMLACAPEQKISTTITKPDAKVNVGQAVQEPSTEPKQQISSEVKGLLDKSKTNVKSIYYKYRGPETGNNFYEFYVKGNKIKYKPALEIKSLDKKESYDSIYIDKIAHTAQSYCDAIYCLYKGKTEDLNYRDVYISTIIDWVDGITEAKKVGEEIIDRRNTWKIESNKGILWVDTLYGVPLKIESSGKKYRFEQISFSSVEDADVVPS